MKILFNKKAKLRIWRGGGAGTFPSHGGVLRMLPMKSVVLLVALLLWPSSAPAYPSEWPARGGSDPGDSTGGPSRVPALPLPSCYCPPCSCTTLASCGGVLLASRPHPRGPACASPASRLWVPNVAGGARRGPPGSRD